NIWRCYLFSIDKTFVETENKIKRNEDKQLFIVTGDSPLITTEEVDDFISNSDMENHDYIIGLTDIQNLKRFSPNEKKGLPGIRMAPIHFKEKLYRINNLHLAKPAKVKNRHLINKLYQLRYLKEWSNMIKLLIFMKRQHFKKGDFGTFLIMEFALLARKYHFLKVANYLRQFSPIERIEQVLSNILDARFGYHETPFGDSTIDVDNETDYLTIKQRWDEWKSKRKKRNISPAQS
ncbi:MAG: hypothetical protein HQK84_05880, partial [Nitrospinae bacterium]|nr:hypothetical protein [Nitrospinota bacterium]